MGEYVNIGKGEIIRSFYPVSQIDQQGFFDILSKKQNIISENFWNEQIIDQLKEGDSLQIISKNFKYKYLGFGKFVFKKGD